MQGQQEATDGSPPPAPPQRLRSWSRSRASTPAVETWVETLEQVMTAAADGVSASGDVRRARMILEVRGRLIPRIRRG